MFVKLKVKNYVYGHAEESILITRLEDIAAFASGSQGVRITMKDGSILAINHTLKEIEDWLLEDDLIHLPE